MTKKPTTTSVTTEITVMVITVPYVELGGAHLFLVIGLPINQEGKILECFQSKKVFLNESLCPEWGFNNLAKTFGAHLELPPGYKWGFGHYELESFDQIQAVVDTELETLRAIQHNYKTLIAMQPAIGYKAISF